MSSREAQAAATARMEPVSRVAAEAERLSDAKRRAVVDTFITLIEGVYAHLPRKRATYGHDPVQRLKTLRQRVGAISERDFHHSMAEIITALHDAHTRYIGPGNIQGKVAFLPFLVESYEENGRIGYFVSKIFPAGNERYFEERGFERGVEITHWNGVPFDIAVERYADRETGGRPDARRARALETLTLRSLRYALLPDEDWVVVSFQRKDGEQGAIQLEWNIVDQADFPRVTDSAGVEGFAYAGDPAAETIRRVKKLLFATDKWLEEQEGRLPSLQKSVAENRAAGNWFTGEYQDAVAARLVSWTNGEFGLLRVWSFDLRDDDGFINGITELLDQLPRDGLVVDLRGNPGGLIWAAERLLQLFTPNPIEPTQFSILATDLTRTMAGARHNRHRLAPWRRSLASAALNGELYSRSLPLTPPERCNDIGQIYPGPVIAVVDANTYSAGDLFAAGFVDNRVGTLVSVDEATGAGGANVWYPAHIEASLAGTPETLEPLPEGVSYNISFRRAVRSGDLAGTGIEDVGIPGHLRRPLTKKDLIERNVDLLEFCGQLLASEPVTDLKTRVVDNALEIETTNLDVVDLFVDGHPRGSLSTGSRTGTATLQYPFQGPWHQTEVIGYTGDVRRQRRLLHPPGASRSAP